jgi:23S rRNA pseudouridine1911/1915/1917 synthase
LYTLFHKRRMNSSIIVPEKSLPFNHSFIWTVEQDNSINRLDSYIAYKTDLFSRSFVQKMILKGEVKVNGTIAHKSSYTLKSGDTVLVDVAPPFVPQLEDIRKATEQIEIIYEHEHFFIINKPAGIIVHRPHADSTEITVVDWLMTHHLIENTVGDLARPGIVHRLDKNTSGIMLIARTPYGHASLAKLFQDRLIKKTYTALVHGLPPAKGTVDLFIGRDPVTKTRMLASRVKNDRTFRSALTHFITVQQLKEYALIQAFPVTGRTHQIRVHLATAGYPLIGDTVYGKSSELIPRHALHATAITFTFDGSLIDVFTCVPRDMQHFID